MKKIIIVYIVFALMFLLCGCLFNDEESENTIIKYVNDNYEKLETVVKNEIPNDDEKSEFLKHYLGNDSIVKSIYKYNDNDNIIDFYCGGTGLATNSTYTGFYYSKDDSVYGMNFDDVKLSETSNGVLKLFQRVKQRGEEHMKFVLCAFGRTTQFKMKIPMFQAEQTVLV